MLRRPQRLPRALSDALAINVLPFSHSVTTVFACCRFSASTTLSPCLVSDFVRDSIIWPDNLPVQHDQRHPQIAGHAHHGVLQLDMLVRDVLHLFQLMSWSA